jgi:hypothetical protein
MGEKRIEEGLASADPQWGGFNLKRMMQPSLRSGFFILFRQLARVLRPRTRRRPKMKNPAVAGLHHPFQVAERAGFEPAIPFWSIHTFQACSFNHSDTSPVFTSSRWKGRKDSQIFSRDTWAFQVSTR